MKKRCNVCWMATLGGFAIAFFGFAVIIHGWPVKFFSQTTAAWVQAIGSVLAIYYSSRIGKEQIRNASEIHGRDIDDRRKARESEIILRSKDKEARAASQREDALAEVAVHRVAVKRIELEIASRHQAIEDRTNQVKRERGSLSQYEAKRDSLARYADKDELQNISKDIEVTQEHLKRSEDFLAHVAQACETWITQIAGLPRSVIRIADGRLAAQITAAINNLQTAVLNIENKRYDEGIAGPVRAASHNLREYLRVLDLLIDARLPR